MAPIDEAIGFFKNAFANENTGGLLSILLPDQSQMAMVLRLRDNLRSIPFEKISDRVEANNVFDPREETNRLLGSVVREYFRYVREYDTPPEKGQDTGLTRLKRDFRNFDILTQRLADLYRPQRDTGRGAGPPDVDWLSEIMKRVSVALLRQAGDIDRMSGVNIIATISDATARLNKVLLSAVNGIADTRPRYLLRASAAIFISNQLFRVHHRTNSMHLFEQVMRPMLSTRQLHVLTDRVPKADAVEFRYWVGRYKLNLGNIQQARDLLQLAFNDCPNRSKNKRTILIYLTAASIGCGIAPRPALLSAFNLHAQFGPIIEYVKYGNGAAFERHLNAWMPWFAKFELVLVLKEKVTFMIWRTILRRVALITDPVSLREDKDVQISLKLVADALKIGYQDASYDADDAQMIVLCLIDQGYARGGVRHVSATVTKLHIPPPSALTKLAAKPHSHELYHID
ncbi:hypothetical protein FRC01_008704 [Tulasnella sp. 417]|nr:hypothetical protein FRC01_008704 [Tulasnella sp. 417]